MDIRPLDRLKDRHALEVFFAGAADYVVLETGASPTSATVDTYFDERPPNVERENTLHEGMYDDEGLIGVAGVIYGYPEPNDAYIGLLLMSKDTRGQGAGANLLEHLTQIARANGMKRQLVAVLDANPKGRAFWDREGFLFEKSFPPTDDNHTRHRLIRMI